jgi:serine/threonine-protein kinase
MHAQTLQTRTRPPRLELRPDAVFADRFVLRDELGTGGVATVWEAWDRVRFREVALKIIEIVSHQEDAVERFGREAVLAARVRHPGVVRPLDAGTCNGILWISMPVVRGQNLRSYVRRGALPLDQALELGVDCCRAVAAVHDAGVLHRDIKTGNFLLTRSGRVQLIDFGLARTLEHGALGTAHENLEGSPLYCPPERFRGTAEDERSEVWALGVTLYELLTGRLPITGHDIAVICANVITAPIEPPSTHEPCIPEALDELILAMLDRNPEGRPADVHVVRAALEAIQAARFELPSFAA